MNKAEFSTGMDAVRAALMACLPRLLPAAGIILVTGYLMYIAPAIRNGLFYAMLGAGAGSAFALIDCGGFAPLRVRRKTLPVHIVPEAPWQCVRMEQIPDQTREWAEPGNRKPRQGPAGASKTVFPFENRFALAAKT